DDREPGRVAVLALHHHVLAEQALVGETETQSGALRRFVAVVALPLQPAIAQAVEDQRGDQMEGLCGKPGACEARRPIDAADLRHAAARVDAHDGLASADPARGLLHENEEERILRAGSLFQPGLEILARARWIIMEVAEAFSRLLGRRYGIKAVAMTIEIKRLQPNIAAHQRLPWREWPCHPSAQIFRHSHPPDLKSFRATMRGLNAFGNALPAGAVSSHQARAAVDKWRVAEQRHRTVKTHSTLTEVPVRQFHTRQGAD